MYVQRLGKATEYEDAHLVFNQQGMIEGMIMGY